MAHHVKVPLVRKAAAILPTFLLAMTGVWTITSTAVQPINIFELRLVLGVLIFGIGLWIVGHCMALVERGLVARESNWP